MRLTVSNLIKGSRLGPTRPIDKISGRIIFDLPKESILLVKRMLSLSWHPTNINFSKTTLYICFLFLELYEMIFRRHYFVSNVVNH